MQGMMLSASWCSGVGPYWSMSTVRMVPILKKSESEFVVGIFKA